MKLPFEAEQIKSVQPGVHLTFTVKEHVRSLAEKSPEGADPRLLQLLHALAEKWCVRIVRWRNDASGIAYHGSRDVETSLPCSPLDLCIGFHEVGHVALGHASYSQHEPIAVKEWQASVWACEQMELHGFGAESYAWQKAYVLMKLAENPLAGPIPAKMLEWLGVEAEWPACTDWDVFSRQTSKGKVFLWAEFRLLNGEVKRPEWSASRREYRKFKRRQRWSKILKGASR